MKVGTVFLVLFFCLAAKAEIHPFPDWLTEEKAKIMSFDNFIYLLDKYPKTYYRIYEITYEKSVDETQDIERIRTNVIFSDPTCDKRRVTSSFMSPLCNDKECFMFIGLTDCMDNLLAEEVIAR